MVNVVVYGCYSSMKTCFELQTRMEEALMQGRLEFTRSVSAYVPQVRTWFLLLLYEV